MKRATSTAALLVLLLASGRADAQCARSTTRCHRGAVAATLVVGIATRGAVVATSYGLLSLTRAWPRFSVDSDSYDVRFTIAQAALVPLVSGVAGGTTAFTTSRTMSGALGTELPAGGLRRAFFGQLIGLAAALPIALVGWSESRDVTTADEALRANRLSFLWAPLAHTLVGAGASTWLLASQHASSASAGRPPRVPSFAVHVIASDGLALGATGFW